MGWMKKDSENAKAASGRVTHKISGPVTEADAWGTGVEWHHAAGHSRGRGVLYFYAKTSEEYAKVDALAEEVASRKAEKRKRKFPSKASAWRHIQANLENRKEDRGFGKIEIMNGKYGLFECAFGVPNYVFFFESEAERDDIRAAI